MSTIERTHPVADDAGEARGIRPSRRRRSRRGWVGVGLLVVAALLGVVVWHEVTRAPHAFREHAFSVSMSGPSSVGRPMNFGLGTDVPDVAVVEARVILAEGSAAAATSLSVCRPRGSFGVGAVAGSLDRHCSDLLPIDGLDLAEEGPRAGLVLTVVPLEPGTVTVRGMDIPTTRGAATAPSASMST
ncbi:MAG: hypothetical protein JWM89_2321 [Acidimicrobiales bacterium]|nr:hypothetical protein [Acidimicrobiales bacterium]